VKVTIYIEGGAPGPKADAKFREAWSTFFGKAGLPRRPTVVRGKGRTETFDDFCNHIRDEPENGVPLLLVDSEGLVRQEHSTWQHLKSHDRWDKPDGAGDADAFLMVSCMETWLVADRGAFQAFFNPNLREKHLPEWPNLESVPGADVRAALDRATKACKRPYSKGQLSFELLATISPNEVEDRCPAAKRLLDRLRQLLP
jgi:hypothetical protein